MILLAAIEASIKMMTDRACRDITPVIEAYKHALFAVNPRDRYKPGKDARVIVFLSLFSGAVLDKFFAWRKQETPKALQK